MHHRYRVPGGEERAVEDLAWLIGAELGEQVEVLERDSARVGHLAGGLALLAGGGRPRGGARAGRPRGGRGVPAPTAPPPYGGRALSAARHAGARVVLHLHNYRLVCANGICFTRGEDCTRCHGRDTRPGVRLNCRGGSVVESAGYGASLAAWQRRLAAHVDHFVGASAFALGRLRQLGAPVGERVSVVGSVQRSFAPASRAAGGEFVLFAGRVAEEKGVLDAVAACAAAGLPLVVAGDGPLAGSLGGR